MQYELTINLRLKSRRSQDRVARQLVALFECGTVRESIAEGLHLREDPHLVVAKVQGKLSKPKE
jgi:hypothetical protein